MVVTLALGHVIRRDDVRDPAGSISPGRRTIVQLAMVAVSLATVVSLIPRWPRVTAEVSSGMPTFFTSPDAKQIPNGSVVLSYPFAIYPTDQALLWQSTDHWRWKVMGGYALIPYPGNQVSPMPPALSPIAVQEFLGYWSIGQGGYLVETPPPADPLLVSEVRSYIRRYGIGTVIYDGISAQSVIVLSVFERALGKPISEGGVDLWLHAQTRVADRGP